MIEFQQIQAIPWGNYLPGFLQLLAIVWLSKILHTRHQQQKQQMQLSAQNIDEIKSKITILDASHNTQSQTLIRLLTEQHQQVLLNQQKEVRASLQDMRQQITQVLQQQTQSTTTQINQLQNQVDQHLNRITSQVHKRLDEGFAKTNSIFTDVIKRLALIDQAQQKITDLSTNVVDLQDILANKQARGHFGEIQLNQLISNCLPKKCYNLQHTLSNGKRADCVLFLPEPTGTIAIDAKFPLENYRLLIQETQPTSKQQQLFRQDIKNHINAVASKYICEGETAPAALLFIPAESIFAEIHAHHASLIDYAYQKKVWLVSPTTMMAVLHTMQTLMKDMETQKQVHIIQEHLAHLASDFNRFHDRMHQVAKHIADAHDKVGQVKISADKINKRFQKIENVDFDTLPN